jgi:hypothetical protein
MDEVPYNGVVEPQPPAGFGETDAGEERRRSSMLRRLRVLLLASGLAFSLTTWVLVSVENPAALLGFGPGPSSVARAHLDALGRGDLRVAYGFFSAQYRQQVPFEAYHQLVTTHREMFRTAGVTFSARDGSGARTVLEGQVESADGERYRALFTMVRIRGQWWIDDLRWGLAESRSKLKA